jgi:hypothetical protein
MSILGSSTLHAKSPGFSAVVRHWRAKAAEATGRWGISDRPGIDRCRDSYKRITQYEHRAWRVQEGFLPSGAQWVSQTANGYLWVPGNLTYGALDNPRHPLRNKVTVSLTQMFNSSGVMGAPKPMSRRWG